MYMDFSNLNEVTQKMVFDNILEDSNIDPDTETIIDSMSLFTIEALACLIDYEPAFKILENI